MKKNFLQKLVAFVLVAVLAMSTLAACGGNSSDPSQGDSKSPTSNNASGNQTSKDQVSSDPAATDPWGKYAEPVTAQFVKAVDISGDSTDYTQENNFIDLIADKLGINIEYKWVTTSSAYDQKLALMLAADDLADIMVVDMTTMKQMYDAGQLQPLTNVYETVATDEVKSLMGYGTAVSFETGTIDGELYGIPLTIPTLETMHGLFLRKDWLDNLGLKEPTSFAELEEILYAFTNNDPDQNGANDTYGIGLSKDLFSDGYDIRSIANEMHAYPNAWVEKDGKVVYGSVQPEMKTTLETLAKWYADGVVEPEFIARNQDEEGQLTAQGKIGAFYGVQWAQYQGASFTTLWQEDLDSDWVLIGIPELSIDAQPAKAIVYDNTSRFIVVREGYEHPEVAVKLLNIEHKLGAGDSREWFSTNEEFTNVWDYWGWLPYAPESVHGNIVKWENVFKAIDNNDPSLVDYNFNAKVLYDNQMKYLIDNDYRTSDDVEMREAAANQFATRYSGVMFGLATKYAAEDLLEYDRKGAIVTDTMVDSLASLNKLELESFTRIITGEADISEFDTFVSQWNSLGGEKITQEINDYYGN